MADYRSLFDRDYIGAWDLGGKDCTLVIESVRGLVISNGTKKNKKPVITFRGAKKGFVCNVTNAKAIAAMYGNDTAAWIGKRITIYGTTTDFGGKTVDAIRVRPGIPQGAPAADRPLQERAPDPEMRAKQDEAAEAQGLRGSVAVDEDGVITEEGMIQ